MNIQLFPNWVKKIAFIGFLFFSVLSGGDDFVRGVQDARNDLEVSADKLNVAYFHNLFGEQVLHYLGVISIIFLVIYLLSKEKVEDDYIKLLRLESFQLTFLLIVVFTLFLYVMGWNYKYGLGDTLTIFLLLYLVIFWFKKRLE